MRIKRSAYKVAGFYTGMDEEKEKKARNTQEVKQLINNLKFNVVKVFLMFVNLIL